MSLIAEVEIESPILREALEGTPDAVLSFVEFQPVSSATLKYVAWARAPEFPTLERGFEADPTVQRFRQLRTETERRLYRLTLSAAGREAATYFAAVEHDIVALDVVATDGRWAIRDQVPDREALFAYRDACRELDVPFRLCRLYEATTPAGAENGRYGVTDRQREALEMALAMGYFDSPRETTLAEIATELGISRQALSARLRRGEANLLRSTVADGDGT